MLLGLGLTDCKPKAGGKCQLGQAACTDPRNALACQGGVFVDIPCKGKGGCVLDRVTKKVTCDDSVAEEGDGCLMSDSDNWACSPDNTKALICKSGKFALNLNCRGDRKCHINSFSETISCDIHKAQKGDPCPRPGVTACSTDFKQMLICKDGAFETFRYCRGTTGCALRSDEAFCDESIAELNDPCGRSGFLACSEDGKSELECRSGKFQQVRDCKKTGCHFMNGRVDCN
jgi:hypothetical protein